MTDYKAACEAALGLLRQGQDEEAQELLEDALGGKWRSPLERLAESQQRISEACEEFAELALAHEDETPEIPHVEIQDGVLIVEDDGWWINPSALTRIRLTAEVGLARGENPYVIEDRIRGVLRGFVRKGVVKKT